MSPRLPYWALHTKEAHAGLPQGAIHRSRLRRLPRGSARSAPRRGARRSASGCGGRGGAQAQQATGAVFGVEDEYGAGNTG